MPEIDIEDFTALAAYLVAERRIVPGEAAHMRALAGGVSNRTVLVERPNGEAWVVKQALAKLRVQVDWFSGPERIEREAEGLRWIPRLTHKDASPELVFEDPAQHLLAMRAVPQPHENWKAMLLAGHVEPDHVRQFAELAGAIHANGYRLRERLSQVFANRTFFESLRLEPYYVYTAAQVPAAAVFLESLVEDTLATRVTAVHGDYSPKNVLVYRGRLVLLDHEVIHFGDPAFDVGFAMAHLLSKAHHLPALRPVFAEAARDWWVVYAEAIRETLGLERVEPRAVRHSLGCLLARVAGRSCLEYLSAEERDRQRDVAVRLMDAPPRSMTELIGRFTEEI